MKTITTLLVCILMLTASLAIADHHLRTDYDRSAEFYRYKTFMWTNEPQPANPFMKEWIINAVNAELQAKGLCLVTGNADLAVSATTATTSNKHGLETFYAGLAGGWSWYHYWTPAESSITVVEPFEAGTLVIEVSDTQAQRVVWWGTRRETVSESVKHLNKAVEKMFINFPPGV